MCVERIDPANAETLQALWVEVSRLRSQADIMLATLPYVAQDAAERERREAVIRHKRAAADKVLRVYFNLGGF